MIKLPSFSPALAIIDIPTRVTDSTRGVTAFLIDLIFCKHIDNIQSHGTLPCIADHDGVFVSAELQYTSWWDGSGMKFEMGGMDPTCHHPKPNESQKKYIRE